MNFKFKQCKNEFDMGNFEGALDILDGIGSDDEDYKFALMLKYHCLINLGCYNDALTIINLMIGDNPYVFALWVDKVKCHYFLEDMNNALSGLNHIERLVDFDNVGELFDLAKLCTLVGEYEKSLKYCNRILDIDDGNVDALLEKSLISTFIDDKSMMEECGNKLLKHCGSDLTAMMVPFALKLFSRNYNDCLNMIGGFKCDFEKVQKLKNVVYNQMLCDMNIQILFERNVDLTIDELISLLLKYNDDGIVSGEVRNINYMIVNGN